LLLLELECLSALLLELECLSALLAPELECLVALSLGPLLAPELECLSALLLGTAFPDADLLLSEPDPSGRLVTVMMPMTLVT
jgi:hypothetical protein